MIRWQTKREPLMSEKNDTISRKAAIDAISCNITVTGEENAKIVMETICTFLDRIKTLPSVQPERQTGKWIVDAKRFGDNEYHCNQCGAILEGDALLWRNNYYCYHCGAEMRGKQDG